MPDNFRHAQYDTTGAQIDDPQRIKGLTEAEVVATQALVSGAGFSGITYDAQGRVTGYSLSGAAHTVDYPDSVTVVLSNDSGSRTVGLDASGRAASIT